MIEGTRHDGRFLCMVDLAPDHPRREMEGRPLLSHWQRDETLAPGGERLAVLQAGAASAQVHRPALVLAIDPAQDPGIEVHPGVTPHAGPRALMDLQGDVAHGA